MNIGQDTITYWAPTGTMDTYGKPILATPVQITFCRWEDDIRTIIDKTGEEVNSKAVVYLQQDVGLDGWMFLGTSVATDPAKVVGAYQIAAKTRVPDLRSLESLVEAYLR